MKVLGFRGGHSPNCVGAIGKVDEQSQMRMLYGEVKTLLEKYGHKVIDCNSNASSQNGELSEGAMKANAQPIDLFISLHMNATDGRAYGTEAWTYGTESTTANSYARKLVTNFGRLGFTNRGVKHDSKYYEMRNIVAPNIIFEICFCDSAKDVALYNSLSWSQLAHAIANAIDENIPFIPSSDEKVEEIVTNTDNTILDGTITANTLNVRSDASTGSSILGQLSKGSRVKISTQYSKGDWYSIYYGASGGFIHRDYVSIGQAETVPQNPIMDGIVKVGSVLNVRSEANANSSILGQLSNGTKVRIDNRYSQGNFYSIYYGNSGGFVSKDYIDII